MGNYGEVYGGKLEVFGVCVTPWGHIVVNSNLHDEVRLVVYDSRGIEVRLVPNITFKMGGNVLLGPKNDFYVRTQHNGDHEVFLLCCRLNKPVFTTEMFHTEDLNSTGKFSCFFVLL